MCSNQFLSVSKKNGRWNESPSAEQELKRVASILIPSHVKENNLIQSVFAQKNSSMPFQTQQSELIAIFLSRQRKTSAKTPSRDVKEFLHDACTRFSSVTSNLSCFSENLSNLCCFLFQTLLHTKTKICQTQF